MEAMEGWSCRRVWEVLAETSDDVEQSAFESLHAKVDGSKEPVVHEDDVSPVGVGKMTWRAGSK
jgi:hypothetical protein